MDGDTEMIPSSPTISSLSSSDLDTESTGSFFPDRSTSLGSLMGVTFPDISSSFSRPRISTTPRPRRQLQRPSTPPAVVVVGRRGRSRSRSGWWRLCREEDMARRTSLGEFLQVERRISSCGAGEAGRGGGGGGGGGGRGLGWYVDGGGPAEHEVVGGGPLFEDGRVLPPPPLQQQSARREQQRDGAGGLVRLPILLAGICSGGEG